MVMCFNLRFDSEDELAAIAAGMAGATETGAQTPTEAAAAQPRTPR